MRELDCAADIVSLMANAAIALAAVWGAVVATLGLFTWRQQMTGKVEYELAKSILTAVFKVRDAFKFARNPFSEIPVDGKRAASTKEEILAGMEKVFQERLDRVFNALRELEVLVLEAEVIWEGDIRDRLKDLQSLSMSTAVLNDCPHRS